MIELSLSPTLMAIIAGGAIAGAGIALLVDALIGQTEEERLAEQEGSLLAKAQAMGKRLPFAIGAGLLILVATRWAMLAIAVGVLVLFWDKVLGGAATEKRGIARIEGLATWTESLRDTVAGAVGLEQAIPATAYAAAPSIRPQLETLADRLRVRMPLPEALERFAEDLDDPSADLIIAALILNSRLRGPGLRDVLGSLGRSARLELEMRQRVFAARASTRRSVQIVIGITATVMLGLRLFNPGYVAPYGTPFGQIMLGVVLGLFAAGILWLKALARMQLPERFLKFRRAAS